MDKSNAKLTPMVKPPLAKNEGPQSRKNEFNYISVIRALHLLTYSIRLKA